MLNCTGIYFEKRKSFMNCKFCEAELPEGVTLCPACGKENADELIAEEISAEEMVQEEELTEEKFALIGAEEPLYAEFPDAAQEQYIRTLVSGVFDHCPELDDYISRYSVGWSFARIPRVAAAIMRVAMYEVLYMPEVPNAAAIDAAVEIAKGYESEQVVSFINGILGTFVRTECPQNDAQ
jgi:N utilization substance protein B